MDEKYKELTQRIKTRSYGKIPLTTNRKRTSPSNFEDNQTSRKMSKKSMVYYLNIFIIFYISVSKLKLFLKIIFLEKFEGQHKKI